MLNFDPTRHSKHLPRDNRNRPGRVTVRNVVRRDAQVGDKALVLKVRHRVGNSSSFHRVHESFNLRCH